MTPGAGGTVGGVGQDGWVHQFSPATQEWFAQSAEHLRVLLEAAVADPGRRVSELPLIGEDERRRLLVEWNDTATAMRVPEATVHALVEAQVDRTPDAIAVVAGERAVSYRELDERANRLAHRLIALGAAPGARVGIALERTADLVIGVLGVLKTGAAYVPLDPTYPAERLAFMIEDAAPRETTATGPPWSSGLRARMRAWSRSASRNRTILNGA